MTVIKKCITYLNQQTHSLPLAIFRMAFGFLMAFSLFRFMYYGWIESCYIEPEFHFTYQFFNWIAPFSTTTMYGIVILCALSAIGIGLGFLYRINTIVFFISFTYLELIEKSWYLNHYYFVSLVAFLLILVPANRYLAIDSKRNPKLQSHTTSTWCILVFKLQLCIVYFFGGIAKLKTDWLFEAQPLKIWLKARTELPLIGWLFEYDITPYLFSWSGMLYDLAIPFLLFIKKTRPIAYILVLIFHILTFTLFNIGMFPWLMIFGSLIFISIEEWQQLTRRFGFSMETKIHQIKKTHSLILYVLMLFFAFQVVFPLRHYFLSNNVLWTENGIRFAWHVMVMEKNGYTEFLVVDNNSGKTWKEYPSKTLSKIQEKQMSFQPDMIWQYGQYLNQKYMNKGYHSIAVYVDARTSLNGRQSQPYIDPNLDLTTLKYIDDIYNYIIPLNKNNKKNH